MQHKPANRMEPNQNHRLVEGGENIYSYSKREGRLNLVANQQIKQLDPVSRRQFFNHLMLEYGFTQEEINEIKRDIENL